MKQPKIQFTKEGYQKLETDFNQLTAKRREVVIRLQTAREMGDLSENGAYKAARFELGSTDRELRRLGYLLKVGAITPKTGGDSIGFGSQVTVSHGENQQVFTLVSQYESDLSKQKLSTEGPLGNALLGKKVGESVTITAPTGKKTYLILKVK